MVAVRRRRGPVFRTRIWSSKWDRELLHGRAKNGYRCFNFWALGPYGFVRLRGRSSPALCRPTPDPEPALRSKPRNPRRRKAMGGGVGLASAAGARARGHAPSDGEQCRFSALPPCPCPAPRSCFGDRFGCPFMVEFARGCACPLHVCSSLGEVYLALNP